MNLPYVNSVPANTQNKTADELGEWTGGSTFCQRDLFHHSYFSYFHYWHSLYLCLSIYHSAGVRRNYRNCHTDNSIFTYFFFFVLRKYHKSDSSFNESTLINIGQGHPLSIIHTHWILLVVNKENNWMSAQMLWKLQMKTVSAWGIGGNSFALTS